MKRILRIILISLSLTIISCAYVQTHKNVEEWGSYYEGEVLDASSMMLYKKDDQWYLSAEKAKFKLRYPTVHDSIFRMDDYSPTFRLIHSPEESRVVYHPISVYAAQILQRRDGYFQLSGLVEDMQRTSGKWVDTLPSAQRVPILAEIGGKQTHYLQEKRVPEKKRALNRVLSNVDLVLVDVPATVAYNIAIPIMAPFVFFYEFSRSE